MQASPEFIDELDVVIPTDVTSGVSRFAVRIDFVDRDSVVSGAQVAAACSPALTWTIAADGNSAVSELITVSGTGVYNVALSAGLYSDGASNESLAANETLYYEITRPVPIISAQGDIATTGANFNVDINFGTPISAGTLPVVGDFVCSNGAVDIANALILPTPDDDSVWRIPIWCSMLRPYIQIVFIQTVFIQIGFIRT